MRNRPSAIVAGAGVFGATAAVELARRGFDAQLLDPGPVPHPEASSTDVSKAVRMDYGSDDFYTEMASEALDGWRSWDQPGRAPLFREVGILLLSRRGLDHGGFEADSFAALRERGIPVERLDRQALGARFPTWSDADYADGYFNPQAGWVDSGEAMRGLIERARTAGVQLRQDVRCSRLLERGSRVTGVVLSDGEALTADVVIVATGAWTGRLLPHLSGFLWARGQPVVHLRPADPRPFEGRRFPVWCADIANEGWYGFPLSRNGTIKVGHHGPGRRVAEDEPLTVSRQERDRAVEFVRRTFPRATGMTVDDSRLCLYCDTWDGDFLIDHDPDRPGLVVASGGSGHGFKFTPLLGGLIADVVERKPNPYARRFAWRRPGERKSEQARQTDPS
jgi:glycine/D-amino acid oxidase-like deaminating enzyme